MKLIDSEEHLKVCPHRDIECDLCGNIINLGKLNEHIQYECPMKDTYCPQECGDLILRKDLDSHLKNDCMFTIVNCQYYMYGCVFEVFSSNEFIKRVKEMK